MRVSVRVRVGLRVRVTVTVTVRLSTLFLRSSMACSTVLSSSTWLGLG